MRDAAASAKERVENGVSELRSQFDPSAGEVPAQMPAGFDADNAPTMTVDLPEGMSFNDFDPGEPNTAIDSELAAEDSAPAVRFDPEVDSAVDDDGIPIWEDPA